MYGISDCPDITGGYLSDAFIDQIPGGTNSSLDTAGNDMAVSEEDLCRGYQGAAETFV